MCVPGSCWAGSRRATGREGAVGRRCGCAGPVRSARNGSRRREGGQVGAGRARRPRTGAVTAARARGKAGSGRRNKRGGRARVECGCEVRTQGKRGAECWSCALSLSCACSSRLCARKRGALAGVGLEFAPLALRLERRRRPGPRPRLRSPFRLDRDHSADSRSSSGTPDCTLACQAAAAAKTETTTRFSRHVSQ